MEVSKFEELWQEERTKDPMRWACQASNTDFPQICHAIRLILALPFTSVSAENAFSVARKQISPWSTSLNSTDFETRVRVAFNRRHYSWPEYCHLMGWDKYLFVTEETKRIQSRLSDISGVSIGASRQRSTAQATEARLATRAIQRQNSTSSTPASSQSSSMSNPKKRKQATMPDDEDSLSDSELEVPILTTSSRRMLVSDESPNLTQHRLNGIRALDDLINETSGDIEAMRRGFRLLAKNSFQTIPSIEKLLSIGSNLNNDSFSKMVRDFKTSLREEVAYKDIVSLLSVPFGSQSVAATSSSANMDLVTPSMASISEETPQDQPAALIDDLLDELVDTAIVESARLQAELERRKSEELEQLMGLLGEKKMKLMNVARVE